MIIYFSATGNNQYLATQIAQQLNDKKESIIQLNNKKQYNIKLEDNEKLGIITPTYFMGLPEIVEEYLSKTTITTTKNNYIYIITSYGSSPGYSTGYIKDYLEEQNIKTDAQYTIKMPDTWTPIFNTTDKEKIEKINNKAETELKKIINNIREEKKGKYTQRTIPKLFANIAQIMYDNQRKTSHLHVQENCNQCGICKEGCPINTIELHKNSIHWKTEYCNMCLRCLHRCPQFAIQYDNKTQKHGQYTNKNVKNFN